MLKLSRFETHSHNRIKLPRPLQLLTYNTLKNSPHGLPERSSATVSQTPPAVQFHGGASTTELVSHSLGRSIRKTSVVTTSGTSGSIQASGTSDGPMQVSATCDVGPNRNGFVHGDGLAWHETFQPYWEIVQQNASLRNDRRSNCLRLDRRTEHDTRSRHAERSSPASGVTMNVDVIINVSVPTYGASTLSTAHIEECG